MAYNPPGPIVDYVPPVFVFRNRIEPRPREVEINKSMRAEVRDPLWMLTRQWQFGEFKGDDAGSPISVKSHMKTSFMNRFSPNGTLVFPHDESLPIETRVEREIIPIDYRLQVKIGLYFLKLLDHFGAEYNPIRGGNQIYTAKMYEALFLAVYPILLPNETSLSFSNTSPDLISSAQLVSNEKMMNFVSSVQGKVPNGGSIFADLQNGTNISLKTSGTFSIHSDHRTFVQNAGEELIKWFKNIYSIPDQTSEHAWDSDRMEYSFSCTIPNVDQNSKTVLKANAYYHGHLDWYSLDIDHTPNSAMTAANSNIVETVIENKSLGLIPTPARYGGMPNNRYWAFEDAKIDLGNLDAGTTDSAKILLAEFALVYGNDWFVLPFNVKTGSLCQISQLNVTDVFGISTEISAAVDGSDNDTAGWRMFTLATQNDTQNTPADNRLFLPPVIGSMIEGDPIESVEFIRDEMANMVWAIESIIPDGLSGGMKGSEAANKLVEFLLGKSPEPLTIGSELINDAVIRYQLGNNVPENWIPFIPVNKGGTTVNIQLQRGSMPRVMDGLDLSYQAVKARGVLLNETQPTYFIPEEEVPRSGISVSRSFQRTRWKNGKVVTWLGRRKTVGRGEASSGLQFDTIHPKKAD